MTNRNNQMKVFIALLTIILSITRVTAQQVTDRDDQLFGTWQNNEYSKDFRQVYYEDGKVASYSRNKQTEPEYVGQFVIEKRWRDQESNYWYHLAIEYSPGGIISNKWLTLIRIDSSGNSLEFEEARTNYPSEFSEFIGDKYHHKILYRYE